MANFQKIAGVSGNSFSIGLKANKSTFTVNSTNIQIDKVLDMNTHKVINVTNPAAAQDAMTLNYADTNYINLTQKGAVNGVATLNTAGKIPVAQLPNSVMEFKGAWDASTNLPALSDAGTATKAYRAIQDLTYTADTAGLAGNNITVTYVDAEITPIAIATLVGTAISVSIQAGATDADTIKTAVELVAASLVDITVTGTGTNVQAAQATTSLRYGQDTANSGDVYRTSVEGTQNLGSGNITFYVGDFVIYNGSVWQRSPMADGVQSVFGRVGAVSAANGDYTASQVTNVPAGAIASTTVQAAINELDTEKMALVASPTLGHVVTTNAAGQGVDSGTALSSLATTSQVNAKMDLVATPTLGHVITTDATGQGVDSGTALSTLTGKMNLIATPTLGHLVTTDASGQATDSGTAANSIMLLTASPTNGHVLTTNASGQAIDSGIVAANLVTSTDIAAATKTIAIPIAQANVASTFALPNGAVIKNVSLVVTTPYTATGVISAAVGAVSIFDTSDNDAQTAAQYSNSDIISIVTGAVVSVTVAGTSIIAGASTLYVDFVTSPLA